MCSYHALDTYCEMTGTEQRNALSEFRQELVRVLGDCFDSAYLFGARARAVNNVPIRTLTFSWWCAAPSTTAT